MKKYYIGIHTTRAILRVSISTESGLSSNLCTWPLNFQRAPARWSHRSDESLQDKKLISLWFYVWINQDLIHTWIVYDWPVHYGDRGSRDYCRREQCMVEFVPHWYFGSAVYDCKILVCCVWWWFGCWIVTVRVSFVDER